jgi:hypothetical protein
MANTERGEVELVAGQKVYTLCLSMNAICEMQTRTGKTYAELLTQLIDQSDAVMVRDFLWMTLKKYHAEAFPDLDTVGTMVDDVDGGTHGAMLALERLLVLNAEKKKALTLKQAQPASKSPRGKTST